MSGREKVTGQTSATRYIRDASCLSTDYLYRKLVSPIIAGTFQRQSVLRQW